MSHCSVEMVMTEYVLSPLPEGKPHALNGWEACSATDPMASFSCLVLYMFKQRFLKDIFVFFARVEESVLCMLHGFSHVRCICCKLSEGAE